MATRTNPAEMTGLELMQAICEGHIPKAPMQRTLKFDLTDVKEGSVTFTARPDADLLNPMGSVHGGLALTLIDSAAGASVHTTLPAGSFYGTLETKANLVRTISVDSGPLLAIGTVIHRGSRVATAEARIVGQADGKLYAHGTSTCMIMSR